MSQCCTLKQHLGLLDMLLVPCFKSVQPALPEVVIRDMLLPRYKPNHIDSLAKEASVEDLLYLHKVLCKHAGPQLYLPICEAPDWRHIRRSDIRLCAQRSYALVEDSSSWMPPGLYYSDSCILTTMHSGCDDVWIVHPWYQQVAETNEILRLLGVATGIRLVPAEPISVAWRERHRLAASSGLDA